MPLTCLMAWVQLGCPMLSMGCEEMMCSFPSESPVLISDAHVSCPVLTRSRVCVFSSVASIMWFHVSYTFYGFACLL